MAGVLRAVEQFAEQQPLDGNTLAALQKLKNAKVTKTSLGFMSRQTTADAKLAERFDAVLGRKSFHHLKAGEAWSDAVLQTLDSAGSKEFAWQSLLAHDLRLPDRNPPSPG